MYALITAANPQSSEILIFFSNSQKVYGKCIDHFNKYHNASVSALDVKFILLKCA